MATIKRNKPSLLVTNPELAKEWDYEKNAPLTPEDVTAGSGKRVWWRCKNSHTWVAQIASRSYGHGCPFCSGLKVLSGYNDLNTANHSLAKEWNYEKNSPLLPNQVTANSSKKVWWKCSCGHEWQASINNRSRGASCPHCAENKRVNNRNKTIIKKHNSLSDFNPALALEWNYEKNKPLTPNDVTPKSSKKVWWICKNGHDYEATIGNRAANHGCPYCSGRKAFKGFNDVMTIRPDLANRWNKDRNKSLSPEDITIGSNKIVWWICDQGHEYRASICDQSRGGGCPYCSSRKLLVGFNDLETKRPDLAQDWDYENNIGLLPSQVMSSSEKRVWWKCVNGHSYLMRIASRSQGYGCSYCAGKNVLKGFNDLGSCNPELAKEWDYDKNGTLSPYDVTAVSNRKVWWKCDKGHSWSATIANRVSDHNCPFCCGKGTSMPEQSIAFYLSKVCDIEQRSKKFGYEVDVYIPEYRVAIEYDGLYYHRNRHESDNKKTIKLNSAGLHVIRIIEAERNTKDDNRIYYIADNLGDNFEWALKELLALLSEITGNEVFGTIDINTSRDRSDIRKHYGLAEKKNSLAYKYPELIKEWNYEKNGDLLPESVSYGTKEKVWWICESGHEWKATPNNRVRGNKCPICSKSNRTFNRKAVICIETGKVYNSLKEACEQTNTTKSALSQCCKGKYKTAGGYHWKYCD